MNELKTMDDQERAKSLNRPIEYDTTQFIVTRLGDEQYGIDIKYISTIVRMQPITRVPKVANFIKGVINLRGVVIPVISLSAKMDLPEGEVTKKSRIIILNIDQHEQLGVQVDEVKEVVTLDEEHIEHVAYDKDERAKFLCGVGKYDDKLISLLNIETVLAEE